MHDFVERDDTLENRLASWPKPGFTLLRGNWLGRLSTEPLMSATAERGFPDGRVAAAKINPYLGLVLEDLADAYLYLGDLQNLTASVPPPGFFASEPAYARELRRRFALVNSGAELPDSFFSRQRPLMYYNPSRQSSPPPPPPHENCPERARICGACFSVPHA